MLSNGAHVMSEDRTRIMFGEPPAIEVYRDWQRLVQEGVHAKLSDAEGLDAFQAGKIGMYLQTSAVQGSLLKAASGKWQLRATGMPAFGNKPVVPTNSGSGLAILSNDPDKQRAAWELMTFLTSEHAFQIITAEIGYLPLRTGIVNDENYLKAGWRKIRRSCRTSSRWTTWRRACPIQARTRCRFASCTSPRFSQSFSTAPMLRKPCKTPPLVHRS